MRYLFGIAIGVLGGFLMSKVYGAIFTASAAALNNAAAVITAVGR